MNIINNFDDRSVLYAESALAARSGYDLWTDEAIELLARKLLSNHKMAQEMHARNRQRMAKQDLEAAT